MIADSGRRRSVFPSDDRDEAAGSQRRSAGGLHRAGHRRLDARLRRDRGDRPRRRSCRSSRSRRRRANVVPVRRARGHASGAGVRRLVGQLVLRGHGRLWRRAARQPALREADPAHRDARLAADPRPDHAVGHLRRAARRRASGCSSRPAGRASAWGRRHRRARARCARSTGTSRGAAERPTTRSTSAPRRSLPRRC